MNDAVATEASALRAVVLLAGTFPENSNRIYALINRYIEKAVNEGWPAMAQQRRLSDFTHQIEALDAVLAIKPADDSQQIAQSEMVKALQTALDARRQRIVVSEFGLGKVKWAAILLQALCTLIVIAMVHSDNRLACAIALTVFATGVALSLLLIAATADHFTGDIVGPELLKQVITSELAATQR